jgi:hypothetical protein
MTGILNKEQESDVLLRGFTRRSFFRLAFKKVMYA